MAFIQTIRFSTDRIDEMQQLQKEFEAQAIPDYAPTRVRLCEDRDQQNSYVLIAEFSSYETAMLNSNDPRTQEISGRMMELATAPPTFLNLDVLSDQQF